MDDPVIRTQIMRNVGCRACRHWHGLTCDAFPRGIPSEIQSGRYPHDKPHDGDHGIQFDLDPEWVRRNLPAIIES